MEQLPLQVEARLFDQDEAKLAEMIEILRIEDGVTGKTKSEDYNYQKRNRQQNGKW